MSLREEKKKRTRAAILAAAERSFRDQGHEATRLQDLFVEVGISERTFFNYFPSKPALVSALTVEWYKQRGEEMHTRLREMADAESVLDEFIKGCKRAARRIARDREYMTLLLVNTPLFIPGEGDAAQLAALSDAQHTHFDYLIAVFELAQARGEIHEGVTPKDVLDLYTAVIGTVVPRWLKGTYRPEGKLEARVELSLDALFYGLAPR